MSSRRTEEPTPRRLREARRSGDVATSRELTGAAAFAGGAAALAATAPGSVRLLLRATAGALADAVGPGAPPAAAALARAGLVAARVAAPPVLAAAAAALAAGLAQTGGLVAPGAVRWRGERLDPARGLRRMCSPDLFARAAVALLRVALACGVAALALRGAAPALAGLPALAPGAALAAAGALAPRVALAIAGAGALAGAAELLLGRGRLRRRLRMTREEVLRERREDEGEPRLRAERRRAHRALASAAPLRGAACLVVNPTHVAVALRHERGSDDPPVVLAKGAGAAAARLRAAARRAGVPLVRDPPLARALHRLAEVGDAVPEELYDAAAAVLVHVHGPAREGRP